MKKQLLINVMPGEETRIAVLQDGKLEDLYMERPGLSLVGNVYKAKVANVESSLQAAFVDLGHAKNGFLHISDLLPSYFGEEAPESLESVGKKLSRSNRPPIQQCLNRGQELLVQVIKDAVSSKGPTLSTYLSIPGRILVMMPGMRHLGVSKKIEDEDERRRLRKILDHLRIPKDCGFIIRTAGIGRSEADIERDLRFLERLWERVQKGTEHKKAPCELYSEGDLVFRTVRDVYSSEFSRIVIDDAPTADRIREFLSIADPDAAHAIELHESPVPIFEKFGLEKEIAAVHSRKVNLPGGGYLVIDQTEAVVTIDVNSGKSRAHSDPELSALKTDLEAADAIPKQLRLRDLGGVIICDFIDLLAERHRREVEQRFARALEADRARTRVAPMSEFGIIEMTRQRMRPSVARSSTVVCPTCSGSGTVKAVESLTVDVMRRLALVLSDRRVARAELQASDELARHLLNDKRQALVDLETRHSKRITIWREPLVTGEPFQITLFNERGSQVQLSGAPQVAPEADHGTEHRRHQPEPLGPEESYFEAAEEPAPQREPDRAPVAQPAKGRGRGEEGGKRGRRGRGGRGDAPVDVRPDVPVAASPRQETQPKPAPAPLPQPAPQRPPQQPAPQAQRPAPQGQRPAPQPARPPQGSPARPSPRPLPVAPVTVSVPALPSYLTGMSPTGVKLPDTVKTPPPAPSVEEEPRGARGKAGAKRGARGGKPQAPAARGRKGSTGGRGRSGAVLPPPKPADKHVIKQDIVEDVQLNPGFAPRIRSVQDLDQLPDVGE